MGQFFSPRNLLRIVWRRLPILILILIIGLPLAVYIAQKQVRLYEATAVIQIEAPQVVQSTAFPTSGPIANSQLDLIQQKLTSRDSMIDVITRFNLFEGVESMSEKVGLLRDSVEIMKLIDPTQRFRPDVQPSGLIITVRLGDSEDAAAVANDFLNAILTEAAQRSEARASETLDFFQAQEERVVEEILAVETDLAEYKEANVGSLPSEITAQQSRLTTQLERLMALDQQMIEIQTGGDRLRAGELERQTELLEQQRAFVQDSIGEIEAKLIAAPEVERQLSTLERRLDQLESEFVAITTSRTDAAIRERLESRDQAQRYEVLENAIPPEVSISASRKKIALLGGALATALALGTALLLELLHPVIRNASQLEAQLGVQPVITVPHLNSRVQRRRRWMGLVAFFMAALAIPLWFLFGLRDVVMRLFGSAPTSS